MSQVLKEKCATCKQKFQNKGDFVTCNNCSKKYHFSPCTTLREVAFKNMSLSNKLAWKCHLCKTGNKNPSLLCNSMDQTHNEQHENSSINQIIDDSFLTPNRTILTSDINNLKEQINKLSFTVQTLNETVVNLTKTIANIIENMKQIEKRVEDIEEINNEKNYKIQQLEYQINELQQDKLKNNIVIHNVPMIANMTAKQIVSEIAKASDTIVNDNDVIDAFKVTRKNKIVLKFSSSNIKQEFMHKARAKKLSFNDICDLTSGENGNIENKDTNLDKPLYFNDDLTNYNKSLLWMAKNKGKSKKWKYVWTREGKIFARKSEDTPIILIKKEEDLEKIKE